MAASDPHPVLARRRRSPGPRRSLPLPPPFAAPAWARGPHAQTILGKLLRPVGDAPLRRERWTTGDGDFLDLDFTHDPDPTAPLALVLHGLEGSSARGYVREALRALHRRGIVGVALNFRGCSGEPNRVARAYHSGETDDVAAVAERLRRRFPSRPLGAIGFSLGGNVLLKLLGERGAEAQNVIDAAAAVSVPYDLEAAARHLESTAWGRLYSRYFMRSLIRKTRLKAALLEERIELPRALASRTIREYDDAFTAPIHGFRDAAHYYGESSASRYLADVRVPTLLVHALDDPFLPPTVLPRAAMDANPFLVPAFTRRGGHVGFVHGTPWRPRFWAEDSAADFLLAALRG